VLIRRKDGRTFVLVPEKALKPMIKDRLANTIAAYLVPNGYDPPLARGESTLPPEIVENSVAYVEAIRSP